MAHYYCNISGLRIETSYLSLAALGQQHPVFSVPIKKLTALIGQWEAQRTSDEETHLLFCALLNMTGHVIFDSPLMLTHSIARVENALMVPLAKLLYRGIFESRASFPKLLISRNNQNVANIVSVWTEAYAEYTSAKTQQMEAAKSQQAMQRLQRALHNPLDRDRGRVISEWAAKVAEFPAFTITHPLTYAAISLSSYWKELIVKACNNRQSMISYPLSDLRELQQHLEDNLPYDYGQEFSVLDIVRKAIQSQQDYFGFTIEEVTASKKSEKAGEIAEILQQSHETLREQPQPKRDQYPSLLAFLTAKQLWMKAQTSNNSNNS